MTEHTKTLEVKAYTDDSGNPTCAMDFSVGKVCMFYSTQRLGCHETCMFAGDNGKYRKALRRRNDGNGTLIPLDTCPIWGKHNEGE